MKNETPITPSGAFVVRPEYMAPTEFRIVSGLVRRAIEKGYTVSVIDDAFGHGDCTVTRSRDAAEIIGALATTGGDLLRIRTADGSKVGVIQLVYNGDDTVIADHTDNAETVALVG
jgi:hypothetical protein